MHKKRYTVVSTLIALAASAIMAVQVHAADAREQKLIDVLKSNAPAAEKAITCKHLAIYGTRDAVPALAPLLLDKDLTSWARIALEAIPDPAADDALRDALPKVQGRMAIGVVNSIAYRRDAKAVELLAQRLKDADAEVAAAAAVALGQIGDDRAAAILKETLAAGPTAIRGAAAEGSVVCAERLLAAGKQAGAVAMYDLVRKADVPKQRVLEGIRGAILARKAAGIPLLVEYLRSTDKAIFAIALRAARELPDAQVTDAVIGEMRQASADRQALLILVLADRGDAKALPAVLEAAKNGPTPVRIVAAGVLERLGNVTCVPVLLDAAAADDAQLSQAGKTALARMPGKDIDADLFARLGQSTGKMRQVLIELAELRRIDGALPVFVKAAEDADSGVRSAAIVAIGAVGEDKQAADLARLLQKAQNGKDRGDIEKALMSVSSRWGSACVPHVMFLIQSTDSTARIAGLRALACCGGPEALAAVKSALEDKDETVQDEAVRTLSTWANRWPDDAAVTEPLLNLAKSGKKVQHQVLAIRGYLQFVQGAKKMRNSDRLAKAKEILPLITRPEEKRAAISVLSAVGGAGAVEPLVAFASDPAIADEACSAIVAVLGKNPPGLSKEQRQAALQTVVAKSQSDATKKKAEEMLKGAR